MSQMPAATLDISSLPEYGDAMRKFQIDKGEAEAKGDQLGILQAETTLTRTLSELKDRRFAAIEQQRSLEVARAAVAAKYPKVKPERYAHLQDPAAIDAYAAQLQADLDEAGGGQQPTTEGAGSWGGSAPTSSNAPPANTEQKSPEERLAELRPVVMQKGRAASAENREMRQIAASPIIDRMLQNASQRAGFNVETGEPLT